MNERCNVMMIMHMQTHYGDVAYILKRIPTVQHQKEEEEKIHSVPYLTISFMKVIIFMESTPHITFNK